MSGAEFRSFAIVPAAGRSVRMGQPKLLLPWGESTILETVLKAWRASRVSAVVIIVHPDDAELAARALGDRTTVVIASPPPPDMKASVQHGLARTAELFSPARGDAWLVAPADLPLVSPQTIDQLLAAHDPAKPSILVPTHNGRRGHPVLFPWPLAHDAHHLAADEGINALLERFATAEVAAAADAVADDVDTQADYRRLYDRH